jgi:hypothetical protein
MNKYEVYLADNYNSDKPFMTDWNYELIGDKLRAEFDEYYAKAEKEANAGVGKSKNLLKGEWVKRFMIRKQINLVDDPSNGNLKSVFILRKGEKKVLDERAKESLAYRFEYKVRKNSDGTEGEPTGFMKFDLIEGVEKTDSKEGENLQVQGNDIEYFSIEDSKESTESEIEKPAKEEEGFVCEVCNKAFDTKRQLHAHSLSHKEK